MADGRLDGVITRNARAALVEAQRHAMAENRDLSLREVAREMAVYLYGAPTDDYEKTRAVQKTLEVYLAWSADPEDRGGWDELLATKAAWRVDYIEAFCHVLCIKPQRLLAMFAPEVVAPPAPEEIQMVADRLCSKARDAARGGERDRIMRLMRELTDIVSKPQGLELVGSAIHAYVALDLKSMVDKVREQTRPPKRTRRSPSR